MLNDAMTDDGWLYYYGAKCTAEAIRMTHYNERETDRVSRLSAAISYAAGRASVKRNVDVSVFLASIAAVHDHKGCLSILWKTHAAAIAHGPLMVDAWVFVHELEEEVEHFVADDGGPRYLYSGRDAKQRHSQESTMGYSPF